MMIWIRSVTIKLDKCAWIQEAEGRIAKILEFVGEEKDDFTFWNLID